MSRFAPGSREVGLVLFREITCDLGEGVLGGEREQLTVDLDTLSMAMSDDFGVAVEEGAHLVRVSRSILGHPA